MLCSLSRRDLLQAPPPRGWTLRQLAALLAALLFAADGGLASLLRRADLYPDLLADGCALVAWLVHCGAAAALRRSSLGRARGPPALLLPVLLTVPYLVVTLVTYGDARQHLSPAARPVEFARFVLAAARALPLLVYLLAFAFPCVGAAAYTRLPDTGDMVGEDGSGCVSRLFYLWLTPLLLRGRRGELDGPADLYHLPRKLRTAVVWRYFHQCWEARRRRGAAAASSGRDLWPRPVGRNLLSGTWSSRHQEDPLQLEGDVGLLGVLHAAFGRRYFALGVLKVAVSMLSFAGPLLLSSLVTFMEDAAAPMGWGARCVLGLFGATLLSSLLQNVFAFEVSKVALAARAALVSAVYGKALQVSGCSLAGAALGEVLNLMSTDVDRVVNFFGSFHELWSMPLRFAVTLYLLHLQVGVAFLGGLGVALLLVPLNKVLASRILSNNRCMLGHKDSRVKVIILIIIIPILLLLMQVGIVDFVINC